MCRLFFEIRDAANTIASPNWAAVVSAVASILAVIVACVVAWKQYKITKTQNEIVLKQAEISEQQNRIALFEMRYNVFQTVEYCINFANIAFWFAKNEEMLYICFISILDDRAPCDDELNIGNISSKMTKLIWLLRQTQFLFSEEISNQILKLVKALSNLMHIDIEQDGVEKFQEGKRTLQQVANNLKNDGIMAEMEKMLQL